MYFDRVETQNGPLAEAAFLDKSSSAGLTFIRVKPDFPGADSAKTNLLDLRYVSQSDLIIKVSYEKMIDWFVAPKLHLALAYTLTDIEIEDDFLGEAKVDISGLTIAIGGRF